MSILVEFDNYTLRYADNLADLETLDKWIMADEAHRDIYTPQHFMEGKLGDDERSTCYALEDDQGIIFYIRLSRATRVEIQFAPGTDKAQRDRNMDGLVKGMAFLEVQMKRAGISEWIFDTDNPRLKKAAEQRLGFTESAHEMVRRIEAYPEISTDISENQEVG